MAFILQNLFQGPNDGNDRSDIDRKISVVSKKISDASDLVKKKEISILKLLKEKVNSLVLSL